MHLSSGVQQSQLIHISFCGQAAELKIINLKDLILNSGHSVRYAGPTSTDGTKYVCREHNVSPVLNWPQKTIQN